MSYPKRDWDNTGNEVTKDDFKRIENGIETNDLEITNQKNPTIPGTLAYKINVLTAKVETLWTGTANTGTITLTKKVTNYNQLIFRFTNGFICSLYSWDYPSVFNTGTYMILVPSGSIIMSFANGDITITSNTTSINFGMVKGVKRGDVNA